MVSAKEIWQGDEVEYAITYGNGLVKQNRGVVIDVGSKGVQVRFEPPSKLGTTWLRASQVRVIEPAKSDKPAVVEHITRGRQPRLAEPPPPPTPPAPPAPPAPAPQMIGIHADFAAWREMGRSLIDRARADADAARERRDKLVDELALAEDALAVAEAVVDELTKAVG